MTHVKRSALAVVSAVIAAVAALALAPSAIAVPAPPDRYGAPLALNVTPRDAGCLDSTALVSASGGDVYGTLSSVYQPGPITYGSQNLLVRIRANSIDDSVELGAGRYPIDMTAGDDTIWLLTDNQAQGGSTPTVAALGAVSRANPDDSTWVNVEPSKWTALTSVDDTLYVMGRGTSYASGALLSVRGNNLDDSSTVELPGMDNVKDLQARSDGRLQASSSDGVTGWIWTVSPNTAAVDDSVAVAPTIKGFALSGDDTTYAIYSIDPVISVIGPSTSQVDDTIAFATPYDAFSIDVTPSGDRIFVGATGGGSQVHVIDGHTPDDSSSFPSPSAGGSTAVTADGAITAGSCEATFAVADSTFLEAPLTRAYAVGRLGPGQSASRDFVFTNASDHPVSVPAGTFDDTQAINGSVQVANGCSGTVAVDDTCVVTLTVSWLSGSAGVGRVFVPGTFPLTSQTATVPSDRRALAVSFQGPAPSPTPTPTPTPVPASPPVGVVAVSGDRSASVTWSAPASSGSFPVSHYLATSTPGAHTCLVTAPALECEITSLTNGTAYTFSVKALTGAGWSATSEPSNAVVPRASAGPSIVIAGSRDGRRIEVSGSTTGFGMGGVLNPWMRMPGQSSFTKAAAQILVSADGTFAWSRRSGKQVSVYVATPDGSLRSNTVMIRAA